MFASTRTYARTDTNTPKKQLLYAMSNIQMLIYDDTRRFQQIIQKHFADFHSGEFCSKSIENYSDRRRIRTGSVVVHLFTQPPPMYQRSHVHVCSLDFCFADAATLINNASEHTNKIQLQDYAKIMHMFLGKYSTFGIDFSLH